LAARIDRDEPGHDPAIEDVQDAAAFDEIGVGRVDGADVRGGFGNDDLAHKNCPRAPPSRNGGVQPYGSSIRGSRRLGSTTPARRSRSAEVIDLVEEKTVRTYPTR
jgi:hypothetical protein